MRIAQDDEFSKKLENKLIEGSFGNPYTFGTAEFETKFAIEYIIQILGSIEINSFNPHQKKHLWENIIEKLVDEYELKIPVRYNKKIRDCFEKGYSALSKNNIKPETHTLRKNLLLLYNFYEFIIKLISEIKYKNIYVSDFFNKEKHINFTEIIEEKSNEKNYTR